MSGAARLGDGYGCGDVQAVGSGNVFVNGMPIARLGDATAGHSCYPPTIAQTTTSSVYANGVLVCKIGDNHAGHVNGTPCDVFHVSPLIQGSPDVFIES